MRRLLALLPFALAAACASGSYPNIDCVSANATKTAIDACRARIPKDAGSGLETGSSHD
jgi:hypothetical protein